MKNLSNSFISNTSSFVNYSNFSNSSENRVYLIKYVCNLVPNTETTFAIEEARYNKNLKSFEDIEELFSELEM